MKSRKSAPGARPVQLTWSCHGARYRVTAWPEVRCEREEAGRWMPAALSEEALDAAALRLDQGAWTAYLEFVPAAERAFLEPFRFGRLAALLLMARGPELVAGLAETPALVSFLAAHASLRGGARLRWEEIVAVHERGGIFGVLEWLGLPASRQTLAVLRNLVDPDVPRRLLEPLRSLLWEPGATRALQHVTEITDRKLAHYCHALAA
jgi:hypothetical protein